MFQNPRIFGPLWGLESRSNQKKFLVNVVPTDVIKLGWNYQLF